MDGWNHFGDVAKSLDDVIDDIIGKTCLDAESGYKATIQANGQVDTGNMLNSCFSVTSHGSTYSDGPDREPPPFAGKHQGFAGIAASYSIFQNYGTSRIPARPFFEPVTERVMSAMERAIDAAYRALDRFNQ